MNDLLLVCFVSYVCIVHRKDMVNAGERPNAIGESMGKFDRKRGKRR